MTVPFWVQDAVFYQIFPDRFSNGNKLNDPGNVQEWGTKPDLWGFQGGDIQGVINKFNYLLELGVTAIYFNPIFQSSSNHRYNISDYYRIDNKLGDLKDFKNLLEVAHRNDVRVILDGVFNHCGRGFFAFNDIMENREHSPYIDWFHVNNIPVDGYSQGKAKDFLGWWGFKSLPKFNTHLPEVRKYLLDIAKYWIDLGADGWRLDVPAEIDDDEFWAEFRQIVKTANRDAYIVGEIWDGDPRWVGDNHFDGLMNYPVRDALFDLYSGKIQTNTFGEKIEELLIRYPKENVYAMYVPLGSHDTERLFTVLEGEIEKIKSAFLFQFAFPGAPAIYYGDEVGIPGGKDPDCRRAFPWDCDEWKQEIYNHVKDLVSLRKKSSALRRGDFKRVFMDKNRGCYAFSRSLGDDKVIAVMNASAARRHLRLPVENLWQDGRILRDLLDGEEYIVSGDQLSITVQPWSAKIIG